MSTQNWNCQYASQCRSKGCSRNHPGRAECRFRGGCTNPFCWFNHKDGPLCIWSQKPSGCTNSQCNNRHPLSSSPTNNIQQFNRSQQTVQINSVNNNQNKQPKIPYHERVRPKYIAEHKSLIDKINGEISEIIMSDEFDYKDLTHMGTVTAKQEQILELERQLNTFQTVWNRTVDENVMLTEAGRKYQLQRELYRFKGRLPAFAKRTEIDEIITNFSATNRFLIVEGETGSGKSTQLPQYVADHPRMMGKKVICTQPRKLAATSLAARVAEEYAAGNSRGATVGFNVGYVVGGGSKKSKRISYMTEGKMLELLMAPSSDFSQIGAIIIDEAHERSMICDILLGSFIKSNPKWDNILLIVSSATLDIAAFKEFFSQRVSHVKIPGRVFPVEKIYQSVPYDALLWKAVAECALHIHKSSSSTVGGTGSKSILGDILCFLPGKEDVLKAAEHIEKYIASNPTSSSISVKVFKLYGMQEQEEQKEVFIKLPNPLTERKIIFATDIAETSITIDGVVYVVDSGEKKEMTYDPHKNISSLKQIPISKSSSKQREGRAGRTRPGTCYKLYSQEEYEALEVNTLPEIFRKPLPLAVLYLREMEIDPLKFNWISRPEDSAIKSAEEELRILGALDFNYAPTQLGKLISTSQQDPKVVRMIHSGIQKGLGLAAIEIVSILTVANMFFWNGGGNLTDFDRSKMNEIRKSLSSREGDIATMFNLYSQYKAVKSGKAFVETDDDNENDLNHDKDAQSGSDSDDDVYHSCDETNENPIEINFEDLQINSITTTTDLDDVLDEVKKVSSTDDTDDDNDDEDDDNQSKSSPPPSVVSGSSINSKTKVKVQRIRKWSRSQFINYKALTLIDSSCKELLNIFKYTKIWKKTNSNQDRTPNSEEVLKLFLAGFFLHAARKVNVKGRGQCRINYFSIQSEVTGCLNFKSAFATNSDTAPDWILYDKILRLKSTLFPATSKIELDWIRDECPEFYNQCLQKENRIPTELLELKSSVACIQRVMGKRFVNLGRLEDEYNCLLIVDYSGASIKALCSRTSAERIKARLEKDLEKAKNSFLTDLSEEIYMRNTRIVVGAGYEIKSLLFKNEYTTLYLRNLSREVSQEAVERLVYSKISSTSKIASISVIQQQERNFAIIKCYTPADAQSLKLNLDSELLCEKMIEAVPHRSSDRNIQTSQNIHQAENTKLKLSWPLGPATGRAKIICSSATEGNTLLEGLPSLYSSITRISPIGDKISSVTVSSSKLPNVIKDITTKKFKFVETSSVDNSSSIQNENQYETDEMIYVVQVVGLPLSADEIEVSRKIQLNLNFTPIRVKIDRNKVKETTTSSQYRRENRDFQLSADRLQKVKHIPSYIRIHPDLITAEFIDSSCNRAVIIFNHPDSDAIEKVYTQSLIEKYISMRVHEQPHRIELEHTITFSVHSDLYLFLKTEFKAAVKSIRKWNVSVAESRPRTTNDIEKKNKFTIIRLRFGDKKRIIDCRKKLESLLQYEIFGGDENGDLMQNLYTFTGRMMMKTETETETSKKDCYLHWDSSRQRVYIYGKSSTATERIKLKLNQIIRKIEEWKQAGTFETELMLDKKKTSNFKSMEQKIGNLIKPYKIPQWHMYGSNKIRLSGYSVESLEALKSLLQSEGILFQPKSIRLNQVKIIDDCGLCFCEVESQFMITSVCNHAFCMSCIQRMFRGEGGTINTFPIVCPTCSEKLPVCDIAKAVPPTAIPTLIQTALSTFKCSEIGSAFDYCPKVGCNQLFRKNDSNQLFYYCDNCSTSFCLACTKQYGKNMEAHEGLSCLEFQRSLTEDEEVPKYSIWIREEILTLRCPRCKQAFIDYTGCAALTCASTTCNAAFCALCLLDCGRDAHSHVRTCSKNKDRDVFVSEVSFQDVHRLDRIKKLQSYFRDSIQTSTLRVKVFKSVQKDLADLNIFENHLDGCLNKNVC